MASPWIKVEHATLDKPEVVELAGILGIDHDAAVGKCIRFWVWADQQTQDGDALSVTVAFIDRLVFCPGFAAGLRKVGWLEGRDGRFSIPNFADHNGQSAKKRAQTQKRTQKYRDSEVTQKASPEKRREEKSTKKEIEGSDKQFLAPSVEEVQAYIDERSALNPNWPRATDLTGESFVDHYDGQGWVTGSNIPIKDWKAKVRVWGNKAPKAAKRTSSAKSGSGPKTFAQQKHDNNMEQTIDFMKKHGLTPDQGNVIDGATVPRLGDGSA